jgi:DNA mismatch repair protein MutS2
MNRSFDERVLSILEWPLILNELESRCSTSLGRRRTALAAPLERDAIILQQLKITELRDLRDRNFPMDFGGISDISPLVERTRKDSILSIEELISVKNFLRGASRLRGFLKEHHGTHPSLREHLEAMPPCPDLEKELGLSLTDDGDLSVSRYPILKKLRASIAETRFELEKKLTSMINSPDLEKVLQERIHTTVNMRYCLMVKAGMKGRVAGTIHDVSASGATIYVEPESVKYINDRYIMLGRELENEIEKILAELSFLTGRHADELSQTIGTVACLDFLNAATRFSEAVKGAAPEITDAAMIDLKAARHPLLYLMKPEGTVPNDVELGRDYNCLIISGANTGGKTVLLKTIGCAVLLTRLGLHIPASPDSRMGIFENILADIGDDQNLQQSLSTYSGQITIINSMLQRANDRTLILIDEIIVGTNPRQGAALAQAVLEDMARTGGRIIVTTHYSELKELASSQNEFRNASVSFDLDTLKPTYRLIMGLPGASYAIEIARNYGLPERVLARSKELIDSRDLSVEAILEETQRFREEMEDERARLKQQGDEYSNKKQKLEEEESKLRALTREIKEGRGLDFLEELEAMKRQVASRIHELQSGGMKEAGDTQREIIELRDRISRQMKEDRERETARENRPLIPEEVKTGDRVYVATLDRDGVIDSVSSDRSTAVVIFGGSIKSRFSLSDLYHLSSRKATQEKKVRRAVSKEKVDTAAMIPGVMQTSYNTIDLRGKRVDEALMELDSGLDRMDRANMELVIVIHGHGTGALKQAVRQQLKMSIYVSDFRQGEQGEGGDGVTVVRMRR